jgi:hypothetical protein
MVSVLNSSVIDHGIQKNCIGHVMVSVLDSSVIDHGLQKNCIGGVMVSVLDWSVIDREPLHHRCSFSVTHDLSHSGPVH